MKQYEDLIEKIEWAPGREEMELLEMLVKAADAENDTQMAYHARYRLCLLYTSPSPRDKRQSRMPSSA